MSITLAALCVILGVASLPAGIVASSSSSSSSSESCSAPPASLEVCLSSVFGSLESELLAISASLKGHEATLRGQLASEHYIVSDELTGLSRVYSVAASVREVIDEDYEALLVEVSALLDEKQHLQVLLSKVVAQLDQLVEEKKSISNEIQVVYENYESVKKAHWNVNVQISEIAKAKGVVVEQEADIEAVVAELNAEIQVIEGRIAQMNKRQDWLVSWQVKLSGDLSDFISEVEKFKSVELDLGKRIKALKVVQGSLLEDANSIQVNMAALSEHYNRIAAYLSDLQAYESEILKAQENISNQVDVFSYAFSDFGCEETLLGDEACNSAPGKAPTAAAKAGAAVQNAVKNAGATMGAAMKATGTAAKAAAKS